MTPEWTCGHTAGPACAECYRLLALRVAELAAENVALQAKLEMYLKADKHNRRELLLRYFGEVPL